MGYVTEWKTITPPVPTFVCKECRSDDIDFRDWESSDGAHDDTHYRCNACKREWWVEGADA